jgi:hypothetical protein
VQAFDWKEVEANLGEMEGGKSEQNGNPLCSAILQPVGKILEASKIVQKNFYAPHIADKRQDVAYDCRFFIYFPNVS